MTTRISTAFVLLSALTMSATSACTANIHDNTVNIKDPKLTFTTDVDVTSVPPGKAIPCTFTAENVYLVAPSATPPPEHASDAGHFRIYLDDVASEPLLVTADLKATVTVPASTKAGDHKFICRVHKHDGTATTATMEIRLKVVASTG